MSSPLERLTGTGKPLAAEPPDPKEFEGLKRSGLARLKDAANPANALESRFDLAYNAAHALCLAALRHKGFRPHQRYIASSHSRYLLTVSGVFTPAHVAEARRLIEPMFENY